MLSTSSSLLFLFHFIPTTSTIQFCDETQECSHTELSLTDNLYCRGDQSCYSSDITITNNQQNIYCEGDLACFQSRIQSSSLFSEISDDSNTNIGSILDCSGNRGCYESTINTLYTSVHCNSMQSCFGSTIVNTNDNHLDCRGGQSCAYSEIYNALMIDAFGWRSLDHSTVYVTSSSISSSGGNEVAHIELEGKQSGYYLDIICKSGTQCEIDCGTSNGCYQTSVYCFNGAICNVNCDNSDDCATVEDSYDDIHDFRLDEMINKKMKLKTFLKNRQLAILHVSNVVDGIVISKEEGSMVGLIARGVGVIVFILVMFVMKDRLFACAHTKEENSVEYIKL